MRQLTVDNFAQWRRTARLLLAQRIHPAEVQWCDLKEGQSALFNEELPDEEVTLLGALYVPRQFVGLAQTVACHRDPTKWDTLYSLLWRMQYEEKNLLRISTDPLVHRFFSMHKQVRRDVHKMKAFVRFQRYQKDDLVIFISWYEPDHAILHLVASFFIERFRVQLWIIFTPHGSAAWNGTEIIYNDRPITKFKYDIADDTAALWQTYYRATFNPARIKIKAMRREMPVRYWKNLPEAQWIKLMLQEAPQRVIEMLKYAGFSSDS